eukprot:14900173-Ditylum_brightwellii.AAC.1
MKNERNNSKQQGPASDTTPKTRATTKKSKKHNKQQKESTPGGRCHPYVATFMQGSSKPSGSCLPPPK